METESENALAWENPKSQQTLGDDGNETWNTEVQYLAFLTRHEEFKAPPPKTYDLITTMEEDFLGFVKCWAQWLAGLPADDRLMFLDAAE